MHPSAVLATCCLLALAGCRPKQESTPAVSADVPSGVSPNAASGSGAVPTATTAPDSTAAMLSQLTQAVRRFALEKQQVPKSLDDLVAAGYLNSVPPAPGGKGWAVNKNLEVYLSGK